MLLTLAQKYGRGGLLLLGGLSGLSLGVFCASVAGLYLEPGATVQPAAAVSRNAVPRPPVLRDYQVILDRNLFNPDGTGLSFGPESPATSRQDRAAAVSWQLIGTVSGGPKPLATLRGNGEARVWHLGDRLPDGSRLVHIERSRVGLRLPDGRDIILKLPEKSTGTEKTGTRRNHKAQTAPGSGNVIGQGIRRLGDGRWLIPRAEAELARSNIGQLIRQARVEPNLVEGRTEGFIIRMIRPGSLLSRLGLRVGDILHQVNGINLDSPEKALQIMQQLRQARQLDLALERNGKRLTYSYRID
ncbi:type II secretion system protein C (GspC) [Geothermobacter ehrlichii]|uniref:Type II secretion system protein C (GspC) n=1 Tax=Geothermobacter ehrlichii TaxID=213224 RepID=A0A5D3WI80_9BACT|nr:type II secretion system protein GspC [Geothermobacter ehrlichii]TYO97566.1 type II secretion system protein C (GspC) [Geothermobacter ehrlichii]